MLPSHKPFNILSYILRDDKPEASGNDKIGNVDGFICCYPTQVLLFVNDIIYGSLMHKFCLLLFYGVNGIDESRVRAFGMIQCLRPFTGSLSHRHQCYSLNFPLLTFLYFDFVSFKSSFQPFSLQELRKNITPPTSLASPASSQEY